MRIQWKQEEMKSLFLLGWGCWVFIIIIYYKIYTKNFKYNNNKKNKKINLIKLIINREFKTVKFD